MAQKRRLVRELEKASKMHQKQADIVNDNDPNTDPNDPPYLTFSDYLTKTRGRKSPYKQGPPEKEDTRTDKQKKDDMYRKNEQENRKSD